MCPRRKVVELVNHGAAATQLHIGLVQVVEHHEAAGIVVKDGGNVVSQASTGVDSRRVVEVRYQRGVGIGDAARAEVGVAYEESDDGGRRTDAGRVVEAAEE